VGSIWGQGLQTFNNTIRSKSSLRILQKMGVGGKTELYIYYIIQPLIKTRRKKTSPFRGGIVFLSGTKGGTLKQGPL